MYTAITNLMSAHVVKAESTKGLSRKPSNHTVDYAYTSVVKWSQLESGMQAGVLQAGMHTIRGQGMIEFFA